MASESGRGTDNSHSQMIELLASDRKRVFVLRIVGISIGFIVLSFGAVMSFLGLEGSFDWAFESPNMLTSKLTNASPGVVFAVAGMLIIWRALRDYPGKLKLGGKPGMGSEIGGSGESDALKAKGPDTDQLIYGDPDASASIASIELFGHDQRAEKSRDENLL